MAEANTAIVTGCASGIGAATVGVLLHYGWNVVGLDRQPATVDAQAKERYIPLVGDVTAPESNAQAVKTAVDEFGRLDGVALNAGVVVPGSIDDQDLAHFDRMVSINLRGPVIGVRAALPALRRGSHPSIVLTASVSGMGGDPQLWAYGATKAGVINLMRALTVDLGPEGIRLNAVCPGPIMSPINERTRRDYPERANELSRSVPLQRWGQPHEIGEVIEFLLSERASFVSGAVVPVDGGVTALSGQLRPNSTKLAEVSTTG